VVATALDPWRHDLTATDRFTDLWPLLLVLAVLLWPLDIALRRMSIGRREVAAARGWVTGLAGRRRAAGPRTATAEAMLAASSRARTSESRAALRPVAADPTPSGGQPMNAEPGAAVPQPTAAAPATATTARTEPSGATLPAIAPAGAPPTEPASPDTLARLRDAKRRARDR
jgi:hypothetical protein